MSWWRCMPGRHHGDITPSPFHLHMSGWNGVCAAINLLKYAKPAEPHTKICEGRQWRIILSQPWCFPLLPCCESESSCLCKEAAASRGVKIKTCPPLPVLRQFFTASTDFCVSCKFYAFKWTHVAAVTPFQPEGVWWSDHPDLSARHSPPQHHSMNRTWCVSLQAQHQSHLTTDTLTLVTCLTLVTAAVAVREEERCTWYASKSVCPSTPSMLGGRPSVTHPKQRVTAIQDRSSLTVSAYQVGNPTWGSQTRHHTLLALSTPGGKEVLWTILTHPSSLGTS